MNQLCDDIRQLANQVRHLGSSVDGGVEERECLDLSERMLAAIKRAEARMAGAKSTPLLGLAQPANGDARDAAQAVELVRALCDQLHQMTHRLVWLECQDVTGTNGQASAIRCEAAALRLDINEAHFLIDRLERRYLNGNGHAQPRLPEQPRRSVARLQPQS